MMRYYLLIFSVFLSIIVHGQAFKRIHLRNGVVQQVPISTIDSITYSDGTQLKIYLTDRTLLQIPFNTIDSITYSVSNPGSPFNPTLSYGSLTDIEGNTYKTIQIGTQLWMAENLRVSKFRNNITILDISDSLQWANVYDNNTLVPAWVHYQNDPSNNALYGKLYNWYAAVNPNGICPQGWHVPTDGEWSTLTNFLGGEPVAAGQMKSAGTQYWKSPNVEGTNSSGFSALAGGLRYYSEPAV